MISCLLPMFLTFNCLIGNIQPCNSTIATRAYTPQLNVSTGTYEADQWRVGFIGRHQMVEIKSITDIGEIPVDKLSATYNANVLTNFHFEETFSTIETDTVSTTEKVSSTVLTSLGAKIGIDGVEIASDKEITLGYTIERQTTYSYSTSTSFKVEYDVIKEKVQGKKFYLCLAAYAFKLECTQWQFDDWWWGDYEVKDSRSDFIAYYTLNPYVTIADENGELLE